ncbi:gamma-taxilin isoform X1 [Syngnathus acus]|uniref:gamma-taxilin isoform X1 n=1 Tax=Syngnathus acus TaxID=161584 RepID=UPI0018860E50|nr:gamma-taxilin isoform X1 [Syngnathus acus]
MSVKATEVLAPRPRDGEAADDPMEEFGRRLKEIVSAKAQFQMEADAHRDITTGVQSEVACVADSLSALSSSEEKLDHLMSKHAELLLRERGEQRVVQGLRDNICILQAERSQLETLCRDVQDHYFSLRDEALRRCREDEEKRSEMAAHFQTSLTEIQAQIQQHSARNEKLCEDNAKLSQKMNSLLEQCQRREESLEKINHHRDLQQQLTSAKLDQANALLADAQQKHQREKEYLLAEAVDKTRKCFAMKEEELSTKKKLALYSKRFDEFQTTLAKSNEVYARFKHEMEKMSEKMKKLEEESNVWKSRFENCNKALTDLLEERSEKGKDYEVFLATIHKLEKLCRALQDERILLYAKIKDVRRGDAETASAWEIHDNVCRADAEPASARENHDNDDRECHAVETEEMRRLRAEQVKLQEFAESLKVSNGTEREQEVDPPDDLDVELVAFGHFDKSQPPPEQNCQWQPEAGVKPKEQAQAEMKPQPDVPLKVNQETEPEVKPEAIVKPERGVKAELEDATEVYREIKPEVKPEPDVQLEVNQETEPLVKPEQQSTSEAESKAKMTPGPDTRPSSEVMTEVKMLPLTCDLQHVGAEAPPTQETTPHALGPPKKETKKNKKKRNRNL